MPHAKTNKLFTFSSGGWVVLGAFVLMLAVFVWAVTPAFIMKNNRPPGDGINVESYGFDLTNLQVPRELISPVMLHRDMSPPIDEPIILKTSDIEGKYLVSTDRVIGVTLNGESRAFPIRVMNVHEIVNDTLGGIPIAVTYHWPCDSVVVFDRRVKDETHQFGVSGLVYNSNLLMYNRSGTENLWCQLLGRAISGPLAGTELKMIPAQLVSWADWYALHPDTTVIARDPKYYKRYKHASPAEYFISDELLPSVKIDPLPTDQSINLKSRVIGVIQGDESIVYSIEEIMKLTSGNENEWSDQLGDVTIHFKIHPPTQTAVVTFDPPDANIITIPCFYFAWHAMYPETQPAERDTTE